MTDTPTPEPYDQERDTAEHDVVAEEFDPEVEKEWPGGRPEPDAVRERGHPEHLGDDTLENAPDLRQEDEGPGVVPDEVGYEGQR